MAGALPRPRPCASCPYRRDVPAGVWAAEEYAKLPGFDGQTWEQTPTPFMCHQADGHVCSGWLGCHGAGELLGVRIAVMDGRLDPACYDYETDVPLWASGAEAAEHGMSGVDEPDDAAHRVIEKIVRVRGWRR